MTTKEIDLSFGQVIEARRQARLQEVRKQCAIDALKFAALIALLAIVCLVKF